MNITVISSSSLGYGPMTFQMPGKGARHGTEKITVGTMDNHSSSSFGKSSMGHPKHKSQPH